MVLDQAWIRFDVERAVFVTAGKQQVTWGVARFWNPTDFLHFRPRAPLSTFDQRQGEWMLKLHVPWEKDGLELLRHRSSSAGTRWWTRWARWAGRCAPRWCWGRWRWPARSWPAPGRCRGSAWRPPGRSGSSTSTGTRRSGRERPTACRSGTCSTPPDWQAVPPILGTYESYQPGFAPQVTGGVSWTWKYDDLHTLTLGAEYFYNSLGYADTAIYPWLIVNQQFDPFYVGRNQAGLYLLLPKPFKWYDTTFILSTLANLTDTHLHQPHRLLGAAPDLPSPGGLRGGALRHRGAGPSASPSTCRPFRPIFPSR